MPYMRVDAGSTRPDIWQIDLTRNVSTRVVATPFIEDAAVYSPDGKYIVFSSLPAHGRSHADLHDRG
jgi:Tol biopolymer transport system component